MKRPLPNAIRLRAGGMAMIRRVVRDDAQALERFIRDLSPASLVSGLDWGRG